MSAPFEGTAAWPLRRHLLARFRRDGANTVLGLDALAINKGDKVAIAGDNSLPRLCADLATLAGGLPNVVISPNISDVTLLKILTHSRCRVVFIDLIDAP